MESLAVSGSTILAPITDDTWTKHWSFHLSLCIPVLSKSRVPFPTQPTTALIPSAMTSHLTKHNSPHPSNHDCYPRVCASFLSYQLDKRSLYTNPVEVTSCQSEFLFDYRVCTCVSGRRYSCTFGSFAFSMCIISLSFLFILSLFCCFAFPNHSF